MSVTKQVSLHGRRAYITKDDELVAKDSFVAGGDGEPSVAVPGSAKTVSAFEDFIGTIDDTGKPFPGGGFRALVGDTGHTSGIQAGTNGVFRLLSAVSSGATKVAASGVGVGGASLQWKGNQGPGDKSGRLRFGARVKLGSVTQTEAAGSNRMHVFAGFTDVATYEFPAYDTGAGLIGTADDFCGFLFSPGGDTGWAGVSGRGGTDQTVALDTGVGVNTYNDIEVEINRGLSDTGGTATFFVNGEPKGSISSPVTSNVALSPVICAFVQDTGDNFVDVDWINVSAPRDTGT